MTGIVPSQVHTLCSCLDNYKLPPSKRHCIKCGGLNSRFSMQAYRADFSGTSFGHDCLNGHRDLHAAVEEFPNSPYCEDCGYRSPVPPPASADTQKAPT